MNDMFDNMKREPLLPEGHYRDTMGFYENRLVDAETDQILASTDKEDDARRRRLAWSRANSALEILIAHYSAGNDVASLQPYAVRAFELHKLYRERTGRKFKLWEPDSIQYVMWLLSLAVLLGLKDYIPQIAAWISLDPDDGQDVLVSRLFARCNVTLPGEALMHEKPYADLLRATQTHGTEQQQAMTAYLKHWYRGMKDCYWYNSHQNLQGFFFGYWAFEAGLVTLAWGIDDTPYRDLLYYPKDLVDYARQQRREPPEKNEAPHIACRTGERCPHAGRWGVLGGPGGLAQERFFREGELFPAVLDGDGQERPVTWIVLARDDGGPTRVA